MFSFYLIRFLVAFIVMIIYGYLRAFVSYKLGDDSNEVKNRLTISPREHLDSIGTIMMLFLGLGFIKPMRNNYMNFKNRKRDILLATLLPGIILFVISLFVFYISVYFFQANIGFSVYVSYFALNFITMSLNFFVYNLIPIYPLDGEKLIVALCSPNTRMKFTEYSDILKITLLLFTFMGIVNIPVRFVSSFILAIVM